MTLTVKHASLTGAAANPNVLVDGPKWDADHTITGSVDATQMPALTGDVTSSAGSAATTLATVNSNVGTFGSATQTVQVTFNAKGLATAVANVTVTPAIGSVTGLGTGVATFLATPSSANLRAALTDEVGTGAAYFVGGALGTPASGTLTSCTGLPVSTGVSGLGTGVATFLTTPSSANLAAALTDETGSGAAVFASAPALANPTVGTQTARDNSTKAASTAYVDNQTRDILTAARTYYVRTDGSNSNNGLANTAGGAFLTIQKAIDTVASLDMSIYQVTIQVVAGTYTGAVVLKNYVGALAPIIQGDTTTPSNVVINVTGGDAITNDAGPLWQIQGFQPKTTTSGFVVRAKNGGKIYFQNLDFAASADIHIYANGAATIRAVGNYTISGAPGGNGIHILSADGGYVETNSITVTLTGTPAWTAYMVGATRNGTLSANLVTYSGAATGTRYNANLNGVIYTGGGGANYFPGSVAGSTATGGQYA